MQDCIDFSFSDDIAFLSEFFFPHKGKFSGLL